MLYLDYVGQQFLQSLVPAVAQEAVCVQRVVVAVETQLHQVAFVLHLLRSGEGDLGGSPAEVQRSHCGFARSQPVSHKAILPEDSKEPPEHHRHKVSFRWSCRCWLVITGCMKYGHPVCVASTDKSYYCGHWVCTRLSLHGDIWTQTHVYMVKQYIHKACAI